MGRRVFAEAAVGMLAAVAVALLLAGSLLAREAAAASNDQTATTQMTISGCDGNKVQLKLREYEVFKQHNAHRVQKGLPAFCVDVALQAAAQWHSDDMAERNYYAHQSPDGLSTGKRLYESGYACYPNGGENIAVKTPEATAADYTQSWINSAGHRANIESTRHMRVGVASANDADFGEWYYGNAAYGEYVNYTVVFAGNDCDAPPEDDGTTPPPDDGDTDPGDGDTVNESAPVIGTVTPTRSQIRDTTPRFSATVKDSQTNLGKSNISVYVDGKRFHRFSYSTVADKVSGVSRKLKAGKRHTIKIVADDGEGKSSAKTTRFLVR